MKILSFYKGCLPNHDTRKNPRIVLDYEIDIHTEGNIDIFIGENCYKVGRGDIVLRCPGDISSSNGFYSCYLMTLDLSESSDIKSDKRIRKGEIQKSVLSPLPSSRVAHSAHFDECISLAERLCLDPQNTSLGMELFALAMSDLYAKGANDRSYGEQIEKAVAAIRENYADNFSVGKLAAHVGYSTSYFIKMFKKATGETPAAYRIRIRMEKARFILTSREKSIEETAEEIGYSDVTLFIRHFKRACGVTPSKFRKECFAVQTRSENERM